MHAQQDLSSHDCFFSLKERLEKLENYVKKKTEKKEKHRNNIVRFELVLPPVVVDYHKKYHVEDLNDIPDDIKGVIIRATLSSQMG